MQQVPHLAFPDVGVGLYHRGLHRPGVLRFEFEQLGLQEDGLHQPLDVEAFLGGNFYALHVPSVLLQKHSGV